MAALCAIGLLSPAGAGADAAPGWLASHTSTDQQAIVDYVYAQGPQGTIPYTGTPSDTATSISSDLGTTSNTLTDYGSLAAESTDTEVATGLIPRLVGGAATAAPYIFVAGTGFAAGFAIGTGINEKFLRIGLPDGSAPAGGTSDFDYRHGYLHFATQGTSIYFGANVQEDSYVYGAPYQGAWMEIVRWFEPPCQFTGFGAPPFARFHTGIPTTATCIIPPPPPPPDNVAAVKVIYPYVLPNDLLRIGVLHRYNSATDGSPTYSRSAPADPGTSTVTSLLQGSLESDGQGLHRAWLDYELASDPDPSENPVETGIPPGQDPNDRCRLSTPASDPDTTTDPWTEHDHFLRRDQGGNMVDTSLYWGQEIPPGNKPWEGFGYRKLAQKHGWAQQDIDATVAALALPPVGPITTVHHQTRWEYTGPEYTPSGTNYVCARRVVVQTSTDTGEPQPRQIITSYGRFMRYG